MLERLIELAFELEDVAKARNCARALRIDLHSPRILLECLFDLRIGLEEVAFDLVRSLVVGVHAQYFIAYLHAVVLAAHLTLKKRQKNPILHYVIGEFDCFVEVHVGNIELLHMQVYVAVGLV